MRVLIVASYNKNIFAPFIIEQAEALKRIGCEVEYFGVVGKGFKGYLSNYKKLKSRIASFAPDIIHAHYGLSGLLANLQRRVPVVTTYHGSDINTTKVLRFSKIAMYLSAWNIFVSIKNVQLSGLKYKYSLIPCGIDITNFKPISTIEARAELGWKISDKYILFAGAFDNYVKNAPLARNAVALLQDNTNLVELKDFTREQVALLFYAADALLMTSFTEGSPQVVKEAIYCGCPVVSVDVGDVAERLGDVDYCRIVDRNPENIANALRSILSKDHVRTNGQQILLRQGLDNNQVVNKILQVYSTIL